MYLFDTFRLRSFVPTHLWSVNVKSPKTISCKNLRRAFAPCSFHRLQFTNHSILCALQEQPSLHVVSTPSSLDRCGLNCYHDPRIQSLPPVIISTKKENQSSTHPPHVHTVPRPFLYRRSHLLRFHVYFQRKKTKNIIYPLPFDPLQRKQDYTHPFPTVLLFPLIF